jgi:L,D-transpeptidase YnhG
VTFGELQAGQSRGVTKRQYWARERDEWKIFFEGTP